MSDKKYLFNPERNPLVRADYRPSEYKIDTVDLDIDLDDTATVVKSEIQVKRNPELADLGGPLVLDGEDLKLKTLRIKENGKWRDLDPQEFLVTDKNLTIKRPPEEEFSLEIVTEINPEANTKLSGIYKTGDVIGSQCEAQGFRRITYFLDRPDNLAVFTVRLEGDKEKYPILLSNGNADHKVTEDVGNGRHAITWEDPHPKPSYLFAAVGGNLELLEDTFTTMSGKEVSLRILVEKGYEDKISWAMESIKRSMKWDEEKYGREYDLDYFHIVALDKFNFGAMENKGLNIFNISVLVGTPETSTDAELTYIEAVIGHEYFHNWTGDRITVRDWFELTLKEGLTVLRDREFTGDMHSQAIKDIQDATGLRARQYMEDAGPTSHPIRPDVVEVFDNIYTSTIYQKGSHVLGMMKTMMGDKMWRKAMDAYFDKFDGQAVTCEDFIQNMEDVSGLDLEQFRLWYSQSGTPEISYEGEYDADTKTYSLTLTQNLASTPGQSEKKDMHIPIRVGLIGESGKDVEEKILHLKEKTQTFKFENVQGPVVPSILRGFSAPVKITTEPSDEELIFRMAHDSDGFNKYEATERLMLKKIYALIEEHKNGKEMKLSEDFMEAYAQNLSSATAGDMGIAEATLSLPPHNIIIQGLKTVDPDAVKAATDFMKKTLAATYKDEFERLYKETETPKGEKYEVEPGQVGRRGLHNLALSYLSKLEKPEIAATAKAQYEQSTNMTEQLSSLDVLARMDDKKGKEALDAFYNEHKANINLVNKWFRLQAGLPTGKPLERVQELMKHEAFDINTPNKVSAVIGGFIGGNDTVFHNKDGSGYKFLGDIIIKLNDINPSTAARMVGFIGEFKRYDEQRQALMIEQLERIMKTPKLDASIKELVGKALETAEPKAKVLPFEQATPKKKKKKASKGFGGATK